MKSKYLSRLPSLAVFAIACFFIALHDDPYLAADGATILVQKHPVAAMATINWVGYSLMWISFLALFWVRSAYIHVALLFCALLAGKSFDVHELYRNQMAQKTVRFLGCISFPEGGRDPRHGRTFRPTVLVWARQRGRTADVYFGPPDLAIEASKLAWRIEAQAKNASLPINDLAIQPLVKAGPLSLESLSKIPRRKEMVMRHRKGVMKIEDERAVFGTVVVSQYFANDLGKTMLQVAGRVRKRKARNPLTSDCD